MVSTNAYPVLRSTRINGIMQALQDVRELPADLIALNRTPVVDASDGEIMGRFVGRVLIADLLLDDQRAATYSTGKLQLESTSAPKMKIGQTLSEKQVKELYELQQAGLNDNGLLTNFENWVIDALLLGVRQRMEALIIAMWLDSYTYDRFGVKIDGATWGTPADLKVSTAVAWTDSVNATPVNDVWTLKRLARIRYGKNYRRLTMSTQAFLYMIATTEFQNKARTLLAPNVSFVNLNTANLDDMQALASRVMGMQLEFYDTRYWQQQANGETISRNFLPVNKVVLSDPGDDNKPMVMDFANGIVTETVVAQMVSGANSMLGSLGGPQRGPVAYATANPQLDPPEITYWGVGRGFPRKYELQATAVLTVGTFEDTIPVGVPF
jgi:hypothetical protein